MITLSEAIETCRFIETVITPFGYHCALGGSCLHKGESGKDIDVFVYPHTTNQQKPSQLLLNLLSDNGVKIVTRRDHEYDDKEVWQMDRSGVRVDVFFVK